MCIAIFAPADAKVIPADYLNNAWSNNADGIGIVYVENGEFRIAKTLNRNDVIYQEYLYARSIGAACLIHYRKATHGEVSEQNCHPFPNGEDEFLVHNGVLSLHQLPSHEVDSRMLPSRVLQHLPKNWRELPDIVSMLESYLSGSKVAIIDRTGEVTILNESSGVWDDGNWYSNRSYTYDRFEYKSNKQYSYNSHGYLGDKHYGWGDWYKKDEEKKDYSSLDSYKWEKKETLYLPEKTSDDFYLSSDDRIAEKEDGAWPQGYEWNGYEVCSWCVPESMIQDGDSIIPIYLEDDDDHFECVSCLITITKDSMSIVREKILQRIIDEAEDMGYVLSELEGESNA